MCGASRSMAFRATPGLVVPPIEACCCCWLGSVSRDVLGDPAGGVEEAEEVAATCCRCCREENAGGDQLLLLLWCCWKRSLPSFPLCCCCPKGGGAPSPPVMGMVLALADLSALDPPPSVLKELLGLNMPSMFGASLALPTHIFSSSAHDLRFPPILASLLATPSPSPAAAARTEDDGDGRFSSLSSDNPGPTGLLGVAGDPPAPTWLRSTWLLALLMAAQ